MGLVYEKTISTVDDLHFLTEFRRKGAKEFLVKDDERFESLDALHSELKAMDNDFERLCKLNPEMQERYEEQRAEAEEIIEAKAKEILPYLREQ